MNYNEKKTAEKILGQYEEKLPTDLDALRALDAKVKSPARIFAYSYGTVGALLLGTGMCLAMKVIGDAVAPGIVIGVVGIAVVSSSYALYKRLLAKRRAQYKDEIKELGERIRKAQD